MNLHEDQQTLTFGICLCQMTGSLSDGIGVLTVDDKHERKRQRIRESHTQSSTDHLMAGFRGLGHGIVGGFTSIISQTYSGIKNEGMEVRNLTEELSTPCHSQAAYCMSNLPCSPDLPCTPAFFPTSLGCDCNNQPHLTIQSFQRCCPLVVDRGVDLNFVLIVIHHFCTCAVHSK